MQIEPIEYAPEWVVNVITENGDHHYKPTAVLWNRVYEPFKLTEGYKLHPGFRDRTEEYKKMLEGFRSENGTVSFRTRTGSQLIPYGFKPIGAQYIHKFIVMWVD